MIAGKKEDEETRNLIKKVNNFFMPNKIVLLAGNEWLEDKLEFIKV